MRGRRRPGREGGPRGTRIEGDRALEHAVRSLLAEPGEVRELPGLEQRLENVPGAAVEPDRDRPRQVAPPLAEKARHGCARAEWLDWKPVEPRMNAFTAARSARDGRRYQSLRHRLQLDIRSGSVHMRRGIPGVGLQPTVDRKGSGPRLSGKAGLRRVDDLTADAYLDHELEQDASR